MYDQIWLFGIETNYTTMGGGRGTFSLPRRSTPSTGHMQRGGGVFATGDHGFLGQALCGGLPRVRGMRFWGDFPSADNGSIGVCVAGPGRVDEATGRATIRNLFSDQKTTFRSRWTCCSTAPTGGFLRNAR